MLWNHELMCLLMVYVDVFKMSGPEIGLKEAWIRIRKGIEIDLLAAVNKCLGCLHRPRTGVIKIDATANRASGGVKVSMMEYDEEDFMAQCVDAYK